MSIFTTAVCRVRQVFIRLNRRMHPAGEQSVEEGVGALFSAAQLLRSNRLRKPLVIIGAGAELWRERLLASLEDSDIEYAVWDRLSAPPTADDAENIRLYWIGEKCDCFIALGDSAVIDLVKAAAARAACRGKAVMSMVGTNKIRRRRTPPVMAIPTVAGSGAEALTAAEICDDRGNRFTIADRALLPTLAVMDPALSANVPREALAEAVIRGLCLAAEAYISGYGDDTSRLQAAEALKTFFEAAEPCWNDGGTEQQRAQLLTASRLAGASASGAGGGYAGALSRAAGKVSGVSFGAACAVLLPIVLEKYGNSAAERLSELARLTDVAPEGTRAEKMAALISRIRSLAFRIGLPDTLEGISDSAIDEIADIAAAEANPAYACPCVWTAAQCAALLREANSI